MDDLVKVSKRTVNDNDVYSFGQVTSCNPTHRAAVNPELALELEIVLQIVENAVGIFADVCRAWVVTAEPSLNVGSAIAAIVPDQHVDALLKEEPQIKCVWVVDHVLIKHGVRVAQNECRLPLIVKLHILALGSEEHGVNDCLARSLVCNPKMLALKGLSKHVAHLLLVPEKGFEAAIAVDSSSFGARASDRVNGRFCQTHESLG